MAALPPLTLTTALANATEVFNKKPPHCLTRDFQVVTNLENRATFDELMERVDNLPPTEGSCNKNRLIVILRLLYNMPKEGAKKEDKAKAQVQKAIEALQAKKTASAKEDSSDDKEKALVDKVKMGILAHVPDSGKASTEIQLQSQLSLLLLGYEVIYMDYIWTCSSINAEMLINKLEDAEDEHPLFTYPGGTKDYCLVLNSDESSNPAYSAFLLQWAKLFDPVTHTINFKYLSYADYEQFQRLRSHPVEKIRKIGLLFCTFKELEFERKKMLIRDHCFKALQLLGALLKVPEIRNYYECFYPHVLQLGKHGSRKYNDNNNVKHLKKRQALCRDAEKRFFAAYNAIYKKLHEIQREKYPSVKEKETFLSKFNRRMHSSFLPGRGVIDTFLSPEQLRLEISLDSATQDEKEKPEAQEDKSQIKSSGLQVPQSVVQVSGPIRKSSAEDAAKRPSSPEKSQIRAILEKREISFDKSSYDKRVLEWFDKRKEVPLGFTPDDAVWKHAFTTIVDQFVGTPYSFKDVWKNEKSGKDDTCFCIMADITFVNKETVSGVFQFTFDENGICYHRWFGKMSNIQRLDKLIAQKREKIEFPPLMKPTKPSFEEIDQTKFAIDPYFSSITFEDKENGLIIKIYKVRN